MQQDKVRVKKRLPSKAEKPTDPFDKGDNGVQRTEERVAPSSGPAGHLPPEGKAAGVAPSSVSCADSFEDFAASATGSAKSSHHQGEAFGALPSQSPSVTALPEGEPRRGARSEGRAKAASGGGSTGKRVRVTAKLLVHEADAECPFFHWAKGQTIACEGFYPGAGIVQRFQKIRDAEAQVRFCCGRYKNCELYRAIMEARYAGELDRG